MGSSGGPSSFHGMSLGGRAVFTLQSRLPTPHSLLTSPPPCCTTRKSWVTRFCPLTPAHTPASSQVLPPWSHVVAAFWFVPLSGAGVQIATSWAVSRWPWSQAWVRVAFGADRKLQWQDCPPEMKRCGCTLRPWPGMGVASVSKRVGKHGSLCPSDTEVWLILQGQAGPEYHPSCHETVISTLKRTRCQRRCV